MDIKFCHKSYPPELSIYMFAKEMAFEKPFQKPYLSNIWKVLGDALSKTVSFAYMESSGEYIVGNPRVYHSVTYIIVLATLGYRGCGNMTCDKTFCP